MTPGVFLKKSTGIRGQSTQAGESRVFFSAKGGRQEKSTTEA